MGSSHFASSRILASPHVCVLTDMALAMKKAAPMKAAMKGKAMKAMKAAMKGKAMKAMKVKKVSVIAKGKRARAAVFKGSKAKTVGGLTKAALTKSKAGRIVSKKRSARGKSNWAGSAFKKWVDACKQARKQLGVTGFCAVGGKTAQGKALYAKAKSILGK